MPVSATLPSRHLPGPLANTAPQTSAAAPRRLELEYVLPLRWTDDTPLPELTGYLRWLAGQVPVTVVDGSPPEFFARHAAAWAGYVRHVPPDPHLTGANGKVLGVLTGLRLARHEHVVIADDDVRYDEQALRTLRRLLDRADLVRPQNYFDPLPWHAHWDTGRSLLNRAVGADYPGTLGVRRSHLPGDGRLRPGRALREPGADPHRRRVRRPGARPRPASTCAGCRRRPRTSCSSGSGRPTTTSLSPGG